MAREPAETCLVRVAGAGQVTTLLQGEEQGRILEGYSLRSRSIGALLLAQFRSGALLYWVTRALPAVSPSYGRSGGITDNERPNALQYETALLPYELNSFERKAKGKNLVISH